LTNYPYLFIVIVII